MRQPDQTLPEQRRLDRDPRTVGEALSVAAVPRDRVRDALSRRCRR